MPHSPRGPPALKPIASAGIRSDRVNGPISKKRALTIKKIKYMNPVLKDLSFFLGAGMNVISVSLESKAEIHTRYQVCQSKVCGDR